MEDTVFEKAREIFATEDAKRRFELAGKQLVHYTSAENAMQIIKSGEIWLRNVRVMNDIREVEYGFQLLSRSIRQTSENSPMEGGLRTVANALDAIFPGMAASGVERFDKILPALRSDTYVTCLSDLPQPEDGMGRLSMWRNYAGGQTGVGILIRTELFQTYTDQLGIFSTPVAYYNERELNSRLMETATAIRVNREFLKDQVGYETTFWFFSLLLRTYSIALKHPGFSEEREWRVYHTLAIDPPAKLAVETEAVAGVPQRIVKFRLKEYGLAHADLIAGILIGPSPHQLVIADGLIKLLKEKGVSPNQLDIRFSEIPLRTS